MKQKVHFLDLVEESVVVNMYIGYEENINR